MWLESDPDPDQDQDQGRVRVSIQEIAIETCSNVNTTIVKEINDDHTLSTVKATRFAIAGEYIYT